MASKELLNISRDEIERTRLISEYKYEVDIQSKVVHAKKQGIKGKAALASLKNLHGWQKRLIIIAGT